MTSRSARAVVTAMVVLVVASATFAGAGVAQPESSEPAPADEIYVEDDGDAVLVYAADESDDDTSAAFDADIAAGLVYGLVEDPVEQAPDAQGSLSAAANAESLQANGSLSFPQPQQVESLQLHLDAESTSETSRSDLTFGTTLVDESGMTQLVRSAATSGELTMSASDLQFTGDFEADTSVPLGPDTHLAATLRESGDAYTLSVEQNQPVGQATADQWANRSVARDALLAQYGAPAESLGGSVEVSIDTLSLSESTGDRPRLDTSYTLTYRGIDAGLAEMARAALAENPDVSAEQADRLATELQATTINEASVSYDVQNGDPSVALSLDLSEYQGLMLAYFEVAESLQSSAGQAYAGNPAQLREQLEAQAAAGLEQTTTWSGSLTHPDSDTVQLDFELHASAENWQAYVEELETRDLPRINSDIELTGASDGDRISFDGSALLDGDGLFEQLFGQLNASAVEDPEMAAILTGLRESGPRTATLESSYDADGFRLEFGAAFQTLEPLRDALVTEQDVPTITDVVARIDNGTGNTYVHVSDVVDAGASREAVQSLAYVDADTTVYMPGEGDRDFPTMDTERARSFLGMESEGGSGPGFGPAVAVLALLTAALYLRRRS